MPPPFPGMMFPNRFIGPNPNPAPIGRPDVPPSIGKPPPGVAAEMSSISAVGDRSGTVQTFMDAHVQRERADAVSRMAASWNSSTLPIRDPNTGRMMSGYTATSQANISQGLGLDVLRSIERNTKQELELTQRVWLPASSFTGSSINIPTPPNAWIGSPGAAPHGNLIPPFMAGGGGGAFGGGGFGGGPGGGGGFGGGRGGGGRGGGRAWGAGGAAFGGSVMGVTGGLIASTPIGKAFELAMATAFAPQELSALVGAATNKSHEAIDFIQRTSAIGRAGGFTGGALRNVIGADNIGSLDSVNVPQWMRTLGLTPQAALGTLENFGITPTSPGQGQDIVREVAGLKYRGALSGLPAGMVESSAAQSARYGQISATGSGIKFFAYELEPILARATEMGLNRAAILRSIDSYVAASAAGGGGLAGKGRIGDFLMQYSSLPGGRTGEAGLAAASGLAGAANKVGEVPINTIMASSVVSKFKNEGDIKAWLDKTQPGYYEQIKNNPVYSSILGTIVKSINQGDTYGATLLFSQLLKGPGEKPEAPDALNAMFTNNPMIAGLGPGSSLIARGNVGGQNVFNVVAQDQARGQRQSFGQVRETAVSLTSRLQKDLGLTQTGAAALVGNLLHESKLDPAALGKGGDFGLAQWLGTRKTAVQAYMRAHPELTPYEAQVQFLEKEIQTKQYQSVLGVLQNPNASLTDQTLAVRKGYEIPNEAAANDASRLGYAQSIMTSIRRAGPRVAPGETITSDTDLNRANQLQAVGGAYSLWSSGITMNEAYFVVVKAARALADALESAVKLNGQVNQNMPAGAPVGGMLGPPN